MTGAMYAAVSGLKTHMSALNVIGNNISNVNTNAYKATRYTFSEALYTTSRSGSNGTPTTGGRNPAQIGYGCSIGTIDLDMSTKTFTPTGVQMDCMIDGDGFFMVGDKDKLGVTDQSSLQGMLLTRLGNFEEKGGYIVDGDGNIVYGFLNTQTTKTDAEGNTVVELSPTPVLTPLRLPCCEIVEDEDGNPMTKIYYPTVKNPAEGDAATGSTVVDNVPEKAELDELGEPPRVSLSNLAIDSSGRITGMTNDDQLVVVGYVAIGKVDSPNGVTHVDGRYYQALGGAGDLHVTSVGGVVTCVAKAATGDDAGAAGDDANTLFTDITVESSGDTEIINGGLEGSGTDLATEITNMITIQRGYQANTRIVTVTDSMLEELVNMKR